ncbi:hypothetical protein N9F42_02200 [Pseudomonadales bacterium]|nr:hypothetical protein [Pseudomonadales bacterium]
MSNFGKNKKTICAPRLSAVTDTFVEHSRFLKKKGKKKGGRHFKKGFNVVIEKRKKKGGRHFKKGFNVVIDEV